MDSRAPAPGASNGDRGTSEAIPSRLADQAKSLIDSPVSASVRLDGDQAQNRLSSDSELERFSLADRGAEQAADNEPGHDRGLVQSRAAVDTRQRPAGERAEQNAGDDVGNNGLSGARVELLSQPTQDGSNIHVASSDESSRTETPAEHVRNALQLLDGGAYRDVDLEAVHQRIGAAVDAMLLVDGDDWEVLAAADHVIRIEDDGRAISQRCGIARRLLRSALRRIELREREFPRPLGAKRLELVPFSPKLALLPFAPAAEDTCVFCGCTETTPCDIKRTDLSEDGLVALREYFAERGQNVPDVVPCWWLVNTTEPVCSNPPCVEQLLARKVPPANQLDRAVFAIDGRSYRLDEDGGSEPLEGL